MSEAPQIPRTDILDDLDCLWKESASVSGPPLKRGEVAALALLAGEEIRRLREALKFYADPFLYYNTFDTSPAWDDGGITAREALNDLSDI